MMKYPVRKRLVAVLCASALGCSHDSPASSASPGQAVPGPSEPAPLAAVPRARWRLASVADLSRTVLWLSHIQIAHAEVSPRFPWSNFPWRVTTEASGRTREQARELAQRVAALARRSPSQFSGLARSYSDDPVTRERGGSLGGMRASDLSSWAPALDVLAALPAGEVSPVLETNHGFFVFLRRPPAPDRQVSGARIVIAYDGAEWLRLVGTRPPRRSRAQALQLAQRIYEEARANPGRFAELVALYSEHPDKLRRGDMGVWSLREPTPYAPELEVLDELSLGEVAPPLDSPYGFEVLQRTAAGDRPVYAMSAIKVTFTPGDAASERDAEQLAIEILARVSADPARFAEYQRDGCCVAPESWAEGRDEPGSSEALRGVGIGDVVPRPLRQYLYYVIARRIDPNEVSAPPPPLLELPAPERPSLEVASVEHPAVLADAISSAVNESLAFIAPGARDRVRSLVDGFLHPSGERITFAEAVRHLLAALREAMGSAEYTRFQGTLEQHYEASLMSPEDDVRE